MSSVAASLPVIVGGTVAIDHVKTPSAEGTDLLGGSAAYAALAASYYAKPVHLIGIVGEDYPTAHLEMLQAHGVTLTGVERSDGASFTWTGEYFANMNDRTTHKVALNVLESWSVKVPAEIAESPIIVLANMSPDNQLQMLAGCKAEKRFVIADTMDLWISIAQERLHEVLKNIDLFVINESEAREFAGTSNLVVAGEMLRAKGPRYVVIKLGEFGAMLFGPQEIGHEGFFRCSAFPLREVVDPTGAGDSFLGALAGYLAAQGTTEYSFETIRNAVVRGSVLASFTCEAFSTRRLQHLPQEEIDRRMGAFRRMTSW